MLTRRQYERDNTFIRDLRTSQTYALTIDIGIWSGNRRKTEIAESFSQPLITMLRRALRFRRSVYTNLVPFPQDTGPALEAKWREWVEQESFKRYALSRIHLSSPTNLPDQTCLLSFHA
jgi:hypothetical protein